MIVAGRLFGDKAIYTCEEGHRLVGAEYRVCQADGSWSASEPSCHKTGIDPARSRLLSPRFCPLPLAREPLLFPTTFN